MVSSYTATTPYASIEFSVESTRIFGMVHFKDLTNVSAIHIHSDLPGAPILVWLATSPQWERGVAQTTPLANYPCCLTPNSQKCSLLSPYWVPYTQDCSYSCFPFDVSIEMCGQQTLCPWQTQHFIFNIHGYDFQSMSSMGCPTSLKPGASLLSQVVAQPIPPHAQSYLNKRS